MYNELYHYGRLGMKWGMHIYRSNILSPSIRTRVGNFTKRRTRKKIVDINSKYNKKQQKADKLYMKVESATYGMFANELTARHAFNKAAKKQYQANKVIAKGAKFYSSMKDEFKLAKVDMDDDIRNLGEMYITSQREKSKAWYEHMTMMTLDRAGGGYSKRH